MQKENLSEINIWEPQKVSRNKLWVAEDITLEMIINSI